MRTYASGVCASCGKDLICKECGYTEPPIWMQSRHDFETEVALWDNVKEQMSDFAGSLFQHGCLNDNKMSVGIGAYMYRIPKQTKPEIPRRVVRIPLVIFKARGNMFTRPKAYTERRASDKRSLAGYLSAHRIQNTDREVRRDG